MKSSVKKKKSKNFFAGSVLAYFQNSFGGGHGGGSTKSEMNSENCEENNKVSTRTILDLGIESPEDLECIKTVGTGTEWLTINLKKINLF